MHRSLFGPWLTLALGAAAGTAGAAEITLTGWAYGQGNSVQASTPLGLYADAAGGFTGRLAGAGAADTPAFITYAIELQAPQAFGPQALAGYTLVEGHSYFQARRNDAAIADRLSRLMTYAAFHPDLADSAAGATSLQLAIWNLVYDNDASLHGAGLFGDSSAYAAVGEQLLWGSTSVRAGSFDVYALQSSTGPDLLLLAPLGMQLDVPEPGSLPLAALALLGLAGLVAKRRPV